MVDRNKLKATLAPKKAGSSPMADAPRKTINVKVDLDVWRTLRTEAARRDTTIQALVAELIEDKAATYNH